MKLSQISTAPYQPHVTRVGQKNLPLPKHVNGFDYPSTMSTKKWFNGRPSRVIPEPDSGWMYHNKSKQDPDNNKKKPKRKVGFYIGIAIILLLIVGAIIGIILGLTRSAETTTTTVSQDLSTIGSTTTVAPAATTTTISIVCSQLGRGSIVLQNGTTPTTWTAYLYSFTANKTASTLLFGFETDGSNRFYLDTVSVVNTAIPANQLLINPNFENSSTTPTGWTISCEATTCGANSTGIETITTICSLGYCLESFCSVGRSSMAFLSQTFGTTSGNTYSISFQLKRTSIPSSGAMAFYLDVL